MHAHSEDEVPLRTCSQHYEWQIQTYCMSQVARWIWHGWRGNSGRHKCKRGGGNFSDGAAAKHDQTNPDKMLRLSVRQPHLFPGCRVYRILRRWYLAIEGPQGVCTGPFTSSFPHPHGFFFILPPPLPLPVTAISVFSPKNGCTAWEIGFKPPFRPCPFHLSTLHPTFFPEWQCFVQTR